MIRTIVILKFLLLLSCSQMEKEPLKRRNVSEYYQGLGIARYLLPDLPNWANFVSSGQCRRTDSIKFAHFKNLKDSFDLSFIEILQLQLHYNVDAERLLSENKTLSLSLKDEEKVFFKASEKVQAQIFAFAPPKFKRVHLIWVDFQDDELKSAKRRISKVLNSKEGEKGVPILISLCKSRMELEKYRRSLGIHSGVKIISSELFTPFGEDFKLKNGYFLPINNLLKHKRIYFFSPSGEAPREVKGKFKIRKF